MEKCIIIKRGTSSIVSIQVAMLMLVSLFALLIAPASALSGGIEWNSYDKGINMAKEQNKKIFLYFHAAWCGYCRQMEKSTFQDRALIDYMNANFVAIKVDSDLEKKTADSYSVRGLPTSWFLKANSDKLSNMPGYVDATRLLNILKYVKTESYDKMSYNDFEKSL